jgi:peptidoglycan/LPS O-acetylase OafA/YrhL
MKQSQKVESALIVVALLSCAFLAIAQDGQSQEWLKTKNVLFTLLIGGGGLVLGSVLGALVGVALRSKLSCLIGGMIGAYAAILIGMAYTAINGEATWTTLALRTIVLGLPLALIIGGILSILVWEAVGKRRMRA